MVTQHEFDAIAREVADLVKRISRLEGGATALRDELVRIGERVSAARDLNAYRK